MSVSIELKGVTKVYDSTAGPVHAFGPVDLTIEPERFVALVGPSGCGKSTLLLMIAGLLDGTAGEIRVAGTPVRGPHTDVGMVFQNHVLVDWRTVLGNVLLQTDLRGLRPGTTSSGRMSCSTRSGSPSSRTAIPTSCPGACSSARRSAGR